MTRQERQEFQAAIIFLLVFVGAMLICGCVRNPKNLDCSDLHKSEVWVVGGCDSDGWCGVLLRDGHKTQVQRPAPNQEITYSPCQDQRLNP